jgi:hypothetical protein
MKSLTLAIAGLLLAYPLVAETTVSTVPVTCLTPPAFFWLLSQSQSNKSSAEQSQAPSPGGSIYFGFPNGNHEDLYGFSIYSDFFDVNYQGRVYANTKDSGLFAGTFASLEILAYHYYDDPTNGLTLTSDKTKGSQYHLLGARLGGNIGWRINFGEVGVTPRLGLTLPVFYVFDAPVLSDKKTKEFYLANLLMRSLEMGLTLDFGIQ